MRKALLLLILTVATLAGCVDDNLPDAVAPEEIRIWAPTVPEFLQASTTNGFGSVVRVDNTLSETIEVALLIPEATGFAGAIGRTSGVERDVFLGVRLEERGGVTSSYELAPAESRIFLLQLDTVPANLTIRALGQTVLGAPINSNVLVLPITMQAGEQVLPNDHVHTRTALFLPDGSSLYTNIPELMEDEGFRYEFEGEVDGTPLPVYVYDQDSTEQPDGSKDRCYFTTIEGYNSLLKTQTVGMANARFLPPELAYTREGAEDHPLYGLSMLFVNTVVSSEGSLSATDALPDPSGACFQVRTPALPIAL